MSRTVYTDSDIPGLLASIDESLIRIADALVAGLEAAAVKDRAIAAAVTFPKEGGK